MLHHVSIGVRDIVATKQFYDAVLEPIAYSRLSESETSLGYGSESVVLWISQTSHPVSPDLRSGLHFCFIAPTRESVNAFHAAALQCGGKDNGAPGLRTEYGNITQRSSSIPMAIGSRRIANKPASDSICAPTCRRLCYPPPTSIG